MKDDFLDLGDEPDAQKNCMPLGSGDLAHVRPLFFCSHMVYVSMYVIFLFVFMGLRWNCNSLGRDKMPYAEALYLVMSWCFHVIKMSFIAIGQCHGFQHNVDISLLQALFLRDNGFDHAVLRLKILPTCGWCWWCSCVPVYNPMHCNIVWSHPMLLRCFYLLDDAAVMGGTMSLTLSWGSSQDWSCF